MSLCGVFGCVFQAQNDHIHDITNGAEHTGGLEVGWLHLKKLG